MPVKPPWPKEHENASPETSPNPMTEREIFWPPDLIMQEAMSLQGLAERLETDRENRPGVSKPTTAAPVLLALASELALKAWQCRERNGKAPDKTHDLAKLFDALGDDARTLLEHAMPAHPDPMARFIPAYSGIREALNVNRKLFETWRYPYEHPGLVAETGALKTAFAAIVDTYWRIVPPNEPVPSTISPAGSSSKQTLGNSRRRLR